MTILQASAVGLLFSAWIVKFMALTLLLYGERGAAWFALSAAIAMVVACVSICIYDLKINASAQD
jgi:hypothetical protein